MTQPRTPTSAPTSSPTTQPEALHIARDISYIFDRAGWFRGSLIQFQQEYLMKEGYAHRGKRVERLAGAIDVGLKYPPKMTEYELLILLGPPDYGDAKKGGSQLVYVFDRAGHQDQYVEFNFGADSKLQAVNWIERNPFNQTRYKRFPAFKVVPDFGKWAEP